MNWDYVAGFFDGEGCVYIHNQKRHPKHYYLLICNTNRKQLLAIQRFIKAGYLHQCQNTAGGKEFWEINIGRHLSVLRVAKELEKRCVLKKRKLQTIIKSIEGRKWRHAYKDILVFNS